MLVEQTFLSVHLVRQECLTYRAVKVGTALVAVLIGVRTGTSPVPTKGNLLKCKELLRRHNEKV